MIGNAGTAPIASPLAVDGRGRTAETPYERHVRDLVEGVLLTAPGERVMRPTFGSGVLGLIFAPNDDSVAATTQFIVAGALQTWLGDLIQLGDVTVSSEDSTLVIVVTYSIRSSGMPGSATITVPQ